MARTASDQAVASEPLERVETQSTRAVLSAAGDEGPRRSVDISLRDQPGAFGGMLAGFRRFLHHAYVKAQLWFTPVGCEMRALAVVLEREVFPARKDRPVVIITVHPEGLQAETYGLLAGGLRHIAAFLGRMGIRRLVLDRLLEWNQVYDVLGELWRLRRRFTPDGQRTGRSAAADALLGDEGINVACTQARFDPHSGDLTVRYSYCQTALSQAVRGFKKLGRFEADHRRFFFSARKFAGLALLIGLVPVAMLIARMPTMTIVLVASILSVVSATLVYLFFLTVGSIEYDNEIAQRRLEVALKRLRQRDQQNELDLQRARRVQESLLPGDRLAELTDRVEVAYELLPQRHVGGDFLDVRWVSDRCLAVIIADVAGHGLPAALVSASLATSFWHQLPATDRAIHEKVRRLNQDLCEFTPADSFVTLIYAEIDLAAGKMRYCCAGHPPAVIMDRCGRIRATTQVCGPPVGALDEAHYEQLELPLDPGDTLFLYTDGVTEAHNPQRELFGDERLRAAIESLPPDRPVEEVIAALRQAVLEFEADQEQYDDQALLVIRSNHV